VSICREKACPNENKESLCRRKACLDENTLLPFARKFLLNGKKECLNLKRKSLCREKARLNGKKASLGREKAHLNGNKASLAGRKARLRRISACLLGVSEGVSESLCFGSLVMFCPWWSHRRSDDTLATRVILDSESPTADTITTVLYIGHQSPNLTQVRHTFRRQGSSWTLLRREEGPEIRI
jgi:hypothetical protein